MCTNYESYLEFKKSFDWSKDQEIIDAKEKGYFEEEMCNEVNLLEKFLETKYQQFKRDDSDDPDDSGEPDKSCQEYLDKYHDLEYNITRDFPIEYMLKLATENFEDRTICYHYQVHIEVVKYIFHIWPKSVNSPQSEFYDLIQKIKAHLIEAVNFNPQEYYDMLQNKSNPRFNPKKHYIYYTWWLYVYFPLLEDPEEKILKLIDFVYLEDAQDMLMYGIYQLEPAVLAPFFKKFMLALWKQEIDNLAGMKKDRHWFGPESSAKDRICFLILESGTGAMGDTFNILKKLYRSGYDLLADPELVPIFGFIEKDGSIGSHIPEFYEDFKA